MNELGWKRLLKDVAEGTVVPVVGPQLMVGADGQTSMQAELARRLRVLYGLDTRAALPRFRELNAVFSELKTLAQTDSQVNLQQVYGDVSDLISEIAAEPGFEPPLPIRQLAEIADFRLLVTLTPDDQLAQCLRQRIAVNEIVHSPYLPSSEDKDLPADWLSRAGEVQLLYLFGKARGQPMYAIHDEDVLEYAHNMITRGSHARERFIGELRHRNLLLLGSNFPDWLSRFFLRVANPLRLMSDKPKRDWLIEEAGNAPELTIFLRSFSRDTQVLTEQSPAAFVDELHQRWMKERGGAKPGTPVSRPAHSATQGAMFFVSYCRQTDQAAAKAFVDFITAKLGVGAAEVWFDKNTIDPGDDFAESIIDGIRSCRYFVPVISKASDAIAEKYFRREWKIALDRAAGIMGQTFVVPLCVEPAYNPADYVRVPRDWEEKISIGFAPGGTPDEQLTQALKKLVREARSPAGALPAQAA